MRSVRFLSAFFPFLKRTKVGLEREGEGEVLIMDIYNRKDHMDRMTIVRVREVTVNGPGQFEFRRRWVIDEKVDGVWRQRPGDPFKTRAAAEAAK